ncbi:MAG: glycoside hydrolase family 1 protein [Beduini sp.]|uniref:glycoside hydrolase family 1 protein n=1 Tax=Beduini sp. TaxID=1922300 RepID=UPI0011C98714
MSFPKDFLWGGSISAFQAEGAYLEDGKGLTVADLRLKKANDENGLADSSIAVDFYHHYKEDIQLMKECGLKSFRFSIAWSRIIPDGCGEINPKGVAYYRSLIEELLKNDIVPIVTLYHFDFPQALIEKYNGFASRECIQDFVRYAKVCFESFGDIVPYWLTINEQMVITELPFFQGLTDLKTSYQAFHHMCIAHALVTKLYRSMHFNGQIGPCISYTTRLPATVNSKDMMLAYQMDDLNVFSLIDAHYYGEYPPYFINELKRKNLMFDVLPEDKEMLADARPDFIAINWYVTEVVGQYVNENMPEEYSGPDLPRQGRSVAGEYQYYKNPYTPYSEYNWNRDGIGLRFALRRLYARYRLPVMITENGWSANEKLGTDGKIHDDLRIAYFKEMVEQMSLAIDDGVELFSFNPWSFIDLLSSSQGMDKRYGMVYVDRTNDDLKELKRIKKDSFYYYKDVISKNGAM